MQLGIGTLRLAPHDFWRCTLRELVAALATPAAPLRRQTLDELMQKWPDET